MKGALLALLCAALAGCGTLPAPGAAPRIVHVQVPAPCVPADFPHKPPVTDTKEALQAAPDFSMRYALMSENWGLRDAWMDAAEAQLNICRSVRPTTIKAKL